MSGHVSSIEGRLQRELVMRCAVAALCAAVTRLREGAGSTVLLCLLAGGAAGESVESARIHLEPHAAGVWQVVLETSTEVEALRVLRTPDASRARRWEPLDGEFRIVQQDGHDWIRRRDGAAFSRAAFAVEATYIPLVKDYAPFSPFGDGGLLIHSGRFHACTGECPRDASGEEGPWSVTISPPRGSRAIVHGVLHSGPVTFSDSGDGTNVYVGPALPIETEHFIGVVDGTLPNRIRERLSGLFPALMMYFAAALQPLAAKPMLFASYDPHYASGWGRQGGTLPGQVFVHFYGPGWTDEAVGEDESTEIAWFFAHEAAHLYQGQIFGPEEHSWIHEGGAEAFALLALTELELVSDEYADQYLSEAFDGCARGIVARPLEAAADAGEFDDYYRCGLLMHLAVDGSARRASNGASDAFGFWQVFRARVERGARPDPDIFLETLAEQGDPRTATFLRALATERHPEPVQFLRTGLAEAGAAFGSE